MKQLVMLENKGIVRVAIVVGLILLIPVIGMQVSDEWDWGVFDFVVAGILLSATGFALELAAKNISNVTYRIIACLAIVGTLLLIWAGIVANFFERLLLGVLF